MLRLYFKCMLEHFSSVCYPELVAVFNFTQWRPYQHEDFITTVFIISKMNYLEAEYRLMEGCAEN